MLLLSFHIGSEQYAVSAKQIIEILPLTAVNVIPQAPIFVAGLLDYRGIPVPVIDLCQLTNKRKYNKVLSSRIILVNYTGKDKQAHPLGLIAEKVTETVNIEDSEFTSSGISVKGMEYLAGIANNNGNMIQYIEINELLNEEVQEMLFSETAEDQRSIN